MLHGRRGPALALAAAALAAPAGPAAAVERILSYDSASPAARAMTEAGLTFIVDRTLFGVRVRRMLETQDVGEADLRPASESELGGTRLSALEGPDGRERDLYAILPDKNGAALAHALCRGSDRAWLAFGPIRPGEDLRIRAVGRDKGGGGARLCMTLDYVYHGEWAAPPADLPQPDRSDRFNDAPANRRF